MRKHDIRISGQGGQGVILSGMIIGKAAAIYEDRHATLIQAFGPEARGSTVSAQVMVSDAPIAYPYIRKSDILSAYCQEAYDKFAAELKDDGVLIFEEELVLPDISVGSSVQTFGIPATRLAEEKMGKRLAFNMIMCGFFTAVTDIVGVSAVREAVVDSVPKDSTAFNLKAFDLGFEFGGTRK
jgi:2-oxoglutarate ferredoxin oxidoreductase subunit gamma